MERKYTVSVHEQIIQWFNMPYIPVYKLTFKDLNMVNMVNMHTQILSKLHSTCMRVMSLSKMSY